MFLVAIVIIGMVEVSETRGRAVEADQEALEVCGSKSKIKYTIQSHFSSLPSNRVTDQTGIAFKRV